jgi:antitoxin component YwqK of YwqJK toxin-antitoxin module
LNAISTVKIGGGDVLAPQRTVLERLPLLTVLLLSGGLLTWAVVGAPPPGAVFADAGATGLASARAALPEITPSDVPGFVNEPSELIRELVQITLDSAEAARRPVDLASFDLEEDDELVELGVADPVASTSELLNGGAQGELRDGLPEGRWVVFHVDGEPMAAGNFSSGLPDGPWSWWNPDGSLHLEGEFEAGLPSGDWRGWHSNGTPSLETAYADGEQQGPRSEWTTEGALSLSGNHKAGLRHGPWVTYYPDGTLRSQGTYVDGVREGRWNEWHPDGAPLLEGNYHRGRRDGAWNEWYSNGQVKEGGEFASGRREGWWEFYLFDGTLDRRTGMYTNGRRDR